MEQPLSPHALVTGGSGFIGRSLVLHLQRQGWIVTNVDRHPGPGRWIHADVTALPAELPPADVVFHLAGLAGGGTPSEADLHQVNVAGTRAIWQHARECGVSRLVLLSSIAVLGPSEIPLDETAPPNPATAYGRSKAQAERVVAGVSPGDPEVVVVRPGYVFGADNPGNFGRMVRAIGAARFVLPGRDDTIKAGIYKPDLIALLAHLAVMPAAPPLVHAVYPDTPTVLAWSRMVGAGLPAREPVRVLPNLLVVPTMLLADGLATAVGSRRARAALDTVRKLRESSNVVSRVLPLAGFGFTHTWDSAIADLLSRDLPGTDPPQTGPMPTDVSRAPTG